MKFNFNFTIFFATTQQLTTCLFTPTDIIMNNLKIDGTLLRWRTCNYKLFINVESSKVHCILHMMTEHREFSTAEISSVIFYLQFYYIFQRE